MKIDTLHIFVLLGAATNVAICLIEADVTEAIAWALMILWVLVNVGKNERIKELESYIEKLERLN